MYINIWGEDIKKSTLSDEDILFLQALPIEKPTVDWLWQEIDKIWYEKNIDNAKSLSTQDIGSFYSHPIWIVNGIFTATDKESLNHRNAIKNYLVSINANKVADYGGGSGVLADIITNSTNISIDIIEPYPFNFFVLKHQFNKQISYLKEFENSDYDVIIVQDVLEHVESPVEIAYMITKNIKKGGYVLFANCFYPHVECHLPKTFFLRYTFTMVMQAMGLIYIGKVEDASHALIFQRKDKLSLTRAKLAEIIARLTSPSIELAASLKRKLF